MPTIFDKNSDYYHCPFCITEYGKDYEKKCFSRRWHWHFSNCTSCKKKLQSFTRPDLFYCTSHDSIFPKYIAGKIKSDLGSPICWGCTEDKDFVNRLIEYEKINFINLPPPEN